MVKNKTLAKIAVAGGFFALGSASYFRWKIETSIKQSTYFNLAIEKLLASTTAIDVLGEPVLIGSINLGDTKRNYCDGLQAQFQVSVRGPKSSGIMAFKASRNPPNQPEWRIDVVELMDKECTKKLVIHNRTSSLD